LSLARREYLVAQSFDGRLMTMVFDLFSCLAAELHSTTFVWSDHNKRQWHIFANLLVDGLLVDDYCLISLEDSGTYGEYPQFKGVALGTPISQFPYALEPYMSKQLMPTMIRIIEEKAKYSTSIFPNPADLRWFAIPF